MNTISNQSVFELLCQDIKDAIEYYDSNPDDKDFILEEHDGKYTAEVFYYCILERMSEWINGEWVLTDERFNEVTNALRERGLVV